MKRRTRGPSVITYGDVAVKIYHRTRLKHGRKHPKFTGKRYPLHTVLWHHAGLVKRESFGDEEKARKRANDLAKLISDGETSVTSLGRHDVAELLDAQKFLAGHDITVRDACRLVAELRKELNGHPPIEAARYYVRMHPKELTPRPIEDVATEMYAAKGRLGKSEAYIGQLKHQCGKFSRMFAKNIADVSAADMTLFVDTLGKLSPRTRNNVIAGVRELFRFARKQKYIPKDYDQLSHVELFEDKEGEILIFQPKEMAELLMNADAAIIPALAVGAFAGLRRSEVMKLDWSEINLRRKFITVAAGKAKTKARRLVPITKNLRSWLAPYAKTEGPLMGAMTEDDYCALRVAAAKAAGFAWRRNALRHSFCSYRLAQMQDTARVALEAGNSPQMLFQHYRELVTRTAARAWFNIAPKRPINVTVIPELALA
jgi:integrase